MYNVGGGGLGSSEDKKVMSGMPSNHYPHQFNRWTLQFVAISKHFEAPHLTPKASTHPFQFLSSKAQTVISPGLTERCVAPLMMAQLWHFSLHEYAFCVRQLAHHIHSMHNSVS